MRYPRRNCLIFHSSFKGIAQTIFSLLLLFDDISACGEIFAFFLPLFGLLCEM